MTLKEAQEELRELIRSGNRTEYRPYMWRKRFDELYYEIIPKLREEFDEKVRDRIEKMRYEREMLTFLKYPVEREDEEEALSVPYENIQRLQRKEKIVYNKKCKRIFKDTRSRKWRAIWNRIKK